MTPYETVRESFSFPFPLYPLQIEALNNLCPTQRAGYYLEAGTGKTSTSAHQALYQSLRDGVEHWVIVMPPILLHQWDRFLRSIRNSAGAPLTTTLYQGTPKQRQGLSLDSDFILMSFVVFKNDFDRIYQHFDGKPVGVIVDEATAIKNVGSDNHKAVSLFAEGRHLMLLTGTPVNKPMDAYAYIKLVAPGTYRNKRQFERLHISAVDDYGNPQEWTNLDVLAENMKINSERLLLNDLRKDMKEPLYTRITYNLDPAHMALYKRIAQERLVEFENGREIDAISASALRSALQQVVINWGEFEGGTPREPAVLDLIEEVLEEIGDRKLAIAAHFIRTNAYLTRALAKYNPVAIYGEISKPNKQKAIDTFINDPQCRVILLQPSSAGYGVDGLHHVCSDMIVVEAPTTPAPFKQVVARLDRTGQKNAVHVRVAIAAGTVQVGMFRSLLDNDDLATSIQGGYKSLRRSVYGDE